MVGSAQRQERRVMDELPIVAITIGDPAGVGPEVVAAALAEGGLSEVCRPLVVGDRGVLERAAASMGVELRLSSVTVAREAAFDGMSVGLFDLANVPESVKTGRVQGEAGRAAFEYIERATALALAGDVDAV